MCHTLWKMVNDGLLNVHVNIAVAAVQLISAASGTWFSSSSAAAPQLPSVSLLEPFGQLLTAKLHYGQSPTRSWLHYCTSLHHIFHSNGHSRHSSGTRTRSAASFKCPKTQENQSSHLEELLLALLLLLLLRRLEVRVVKLGHVHRTHVHLRGEYQYGSDEEAMPVRLARAS